MCTKDFRSTKAITLIALVISIVVILLLAGVAIATLTGDNRNFITSTECKYNNENSRSGGRSKTNIYRLFNRARSI